MRIVYVHGFASAGEGRKAEQLRQLFPKFEVISPTLPVCPLAAVELLCGLTRDNCCLVGTSLGGFYVAVVAAMTDEVRHGLLINPVVDPEKKMRRHLGKRMNFKTGRPFDWTETNLESLGAFAALYSGFGGARSRLSLAVGSEDNFTDADQVRAWYGIENCRLYPDEHRFSRYFREAVGEWRQGIQGGTK